MMSRMDGPRVLRARACMPLMPMPHPFPQMPALDRARCSGAMGFALELMSEKNRRESDEYHCYHDAYH
jgi:hypothetical protein